MFLAGSSSSDVLTETYLDKYKWYVLNVQSTLPGRPADPMPEYKLSPSNRILQRTVTSTEQVASENLEKPVGKLQLRGHQQDGGRPAKRGRPGSYGQREAKTGEPNLTITRIFRTSPGTSKRSALERLEPPRRLDSDSESDYEGVSARDTSKPTRPITQTIDKENLEANRSKSDDDDEVMVLDTWDIPPLERSPSTTSGSSSSSDTKEDERAIQALVDKVAAKVRAEFLRGKEERKRRKQLEKEMRKKKK